MRNDKPRFLAPGATTKQLIQACARNHLSWFGNDLRFENGIHWKDGLIAFPVMSPEVASQQLDMIVAYHRQQAPRQVACWSLVPTTPRDLGARLVARGFEWGWRPHWMALNLQEIRSDFPVPENLSIIADDAGEWTVEDLPFYTPRKPEDAPSEMETRPKRQWRFGAYLNGIIVGQSCLHLTTGRFGVAGIYDVGVVPSARNQGVGCAITLAACQFAATLGCRYATLNAATSIYERIGFVSLGYGQTWFLQPETLTAPAPMPVQVACFEAVGQGVDALERFWQNESEIDLNAPLASGMTLTALAARMHKPAVVKWLIDHGATLDIIYAWELGWKGEAQRLLSISPELGNRQVGRQKITPLHYAAEHNDVELARLILSAHPDLTLRDQQYNGTPLNWAEVLGRHEIAQLIKNTIDENPYL